ncbi:AraC-type DNA-binding protein [Pustulibacterium marinum]|uniref:AraC-type DNA-binding protein n=1 Tax=Pustulibacterium marinum TaxID=1224947 RepID=A0A1I7EZG6_9FLAO|nr:helix-turn-helix transcriptional regulator [Pustulibacterium marinum]SFU29297.1 AraC-type DNA-binding protein [Pustulibacterium marinum]
MDFFVKNMVCDRCIMVVKEDFETSGYVVNAIDLGKVAASGNGDETAVLQKLEKHGFEVLQTEETIISDQIKTELLQFLNNGNLQNEKLSEVISSKLNRDYGVLSKHFSKHNHITIEKYFIKLKLEKAKQYIQENNLNFSEIADVLGYNSLSHLSSQFKKETGLSLSQFKQNPNESRNGLDKIL